MDDYTKQALDSLVDLLEKGNDGTRIEAAREILKHQAAVR